MHNETDRWTDEKRQQKFNLEKNKPENRIGIKTTNVVCSTYFLHFVSGKINYNQIIRKRQFKKIQLRMDFVLISFLFSCLNFQYNFLFFLFLFNFHSDFKLLFLISIPIYCF